MYLKNGYVYYITRASWSIIRIFLCITYSFFKYQITEMIPVLSVAGQNVPQHFKRYLEFLAVFNITYLFTTQFLAEALTMFRWVLA
jgi:hypothetical protein